MNVTLVSTTGSESEPEAAAAMDGFSCGSGTGGLRLCSSVCVDERVPARGGRMRQRSRHEVLTVTQGSSMRVPQPCQRQMPPFQDMLNVSALAC